MCWNHDIIESKTLLKYALLSGKSFQIQELFKTQSGEENTSSGHFNPVGRLQQSGHLGSLPSLNRIRVSHQDTSDLVTSAPWLNKGVNRSSIKVHNGSSLLDPNGFKDPIFPQLFFLARDSSFFPVDVMCSLLDVHGNSIQRIPALYCPLCSAKYSIRRRDEMIWQNTRGR